MISWALIIPDLGVMVYSHTRLLQNETCHQKKAPFTRKSLLDYHFPKFTKDVPAATPAATAGSAHLVLQGKKNSI